MLWSEKMRRAEEKKQQDKSKIREEIEQQTEEFLKNGGKIQGAEAGESAFEYRYCPTGSNQLKKYIKGTDKQYVYHLNINGTSNPNEVIKKRNALAKTQKTSRP